MKISYIVKQFKSLIIFFTLIFRSDGRIDYWQGIVYVALGLVMFILNYTLFRIDPELLKKRTKPGEGTKKWDKAILGLSFCQHA